MNFKPYTPPNEGDGPLTVSKDIAWRINEHGLVTPAVIGAVCWALGHFKVTKGQQAELMEGLGLENVRTPMGGLTMQPKAAHLVRIPDPQPDHPWVYEVRPCTEDVSGTEECPPHAAHYWGVYRRNVKPDAHGHHLAEWVVDFAEEADARAVAALLPRSRE